MTDLPHWHFVEWANTDRRGEAATVNALLVGALLAAAAVARELGYERAERRYSALADRIRAALNARHWNEAARHLIAAERLGRETEFSRRDWEVLAPAVKGLTPPIKRWPPGWCPIC